MHVICAIYIKCLPQVPTLRHIHQKKEEKISRLSAASQKELEKDMLAYPQRVSLKNIKIMTTDQEINNKNITNDLG